MKDPVLDKEAIVKEMDKLGHMFATKLRESLDARLEPYMDYCYAMGP